MTYVIKGQSSIRKMGRRYWQSVGQNKTFLTSCVIDSGKKSVSYIGVRLLIELLWRATWRYACVHTYMIKIHMPFDSNYMSRNLSYRYTCSQVQNNICKHFIQCRSVSNGIRIEFKYLSVEGHLGGSVT